jgi:hypothetical protein
VEVLNESLGTVKLRWEEPPAPNGIIVTYQIEYKSVENPNVSCCRKLVHLSSDDILGSFSRRVIDSFVSHNISSMVMRTFQSPFHLV